MCLYVYVPVYAVSVCMWTQGGDKKQNTKNKRGHKKRQKKTKQNKHKRKKEQAHKKSKKIKKIKIITKDKKRNCGSCKPGAGRPSTRLCQTEKTRQPDGRLYQEQDTSDSRSKSDKTHHRQQRKQPSPDTKTQDTLQADETRPHRRRPHDMIH